MYWLVKTDPETYSFENLLKDKKTIWDGVRNYQARNNLELMKKGDKVLVYHSVLDKEVRGIAEVSKESFQDPTTSDVAWKSVELKALKKFKKFVTLEEIKNTKKLKDISLVKQGRLSVMPLSKEEFDLIVSMGN